jgi:capsular polysaccharide biosynthesis protein
MAHGAEHVERSNLMGAMAGATSADPQPKTIPAVRLSVGPQHILRHLAVAEAEQYPSDQTAATWDRSLVSAPSPSARPSANRQVRRSPL